MAQLVQCPTLDFGSGHDLAVHEFKPHPGLSTVSMESAWDLLLPPHFCLPLCLSLCLSLSLSKINKHWGAWVAQSVGRPTSAQVMISRSVSSSPASGSVLTAQSLEPVSDSTSPSL